MSTEEKQSGVESDERRSRERLQALLSVRIADVERASLPKGMGGPPPDPQSMPTDGPGRSSWSWRSLLAATVLIGLFATGLGLTYAGARVVRSSTEGEVLRPVDDPAAPGFAALVDATPTLAVLHDRDGADNPEGALDGVTVLTLPSPESGGGAVVFVPTRTVTELRLFGVGVISAAYDLGSPTGLTTAVGDLLEAAIAESTVIDGDRWSNLVAPVAPLAIENPDRITVDGEVLFPIGRIELEAADVVTYLEATVEGESDLARLYRHQLFWQAWLAAVAAADSATAVPGEVESGLGRFVRTLAAGDVVYETLPVRPTANERYGDEVAYLPVRSEVRELVDRLIPFPRSPSPGVRSRVRVLNGTEDTSKAIATAPALPPAGVEVTLVGNAPEFGVQTTQISYFGREHRPEAEAIRDILGVGEVVEEPRPSDVVDITVTLGADYE